MYQIFVTRQTKRLDNSMTKFEGYHRLKIFDSEDYGIVLDEFSKLLKEELEFISIIDYSVIHSTYELSNYDVKNHTHKTMRVITLQNF
jgi:hypothetical protein